MTPHRRQAARDGLPEIAEAALKYRMATIFMSEEDAQAGILMPYGISFREAGRDAADYVDKILKGRRRRSCR